MTVSLFPLVGFPDRPARLEPCPADRQIVERRRDPELFGQRHDLFSAERAHDGFGASVSLPDPSPVKNDWITYPFGTSSLIFPSL